MSNGGKYVQVDNGTELFVQDVGEGEPLIFVPGFTFTTEVFEKQLEYYAKTNRVVVIDPRSHGRSTVSLHGNDYVTHGKDLGTVLQKLDIINPTIVGWSFGCFTVWEYGKQFGYDQIKAAIFVDMPPKSLSINEKDWTEGALDDIASIYNNFLIHSKGQRTFIKDYIQSVMIQRDLNEVELTWLIEQSLKTPYYVAGNLFASGMFADYRSEAKAFNEQVKTLTVIAEHWADIAVPYIEKLTPRTTIEVLGGHMMFWEHSEKFNQILDRFLSRC